jgi:hypothetical protein
VGHAGPGQPGAPVALVVFTDRFIWHSLGDFGNPMFARRPHFVRPRLIAHGEGGNATPTSIMLYLPNDIQLAAQNTQTLLSLPTQPHKKPQKSRARKRTNTLEVEKPSDSLEAGSAAI